MINNHLETAYTACHQNNFAFLLIDFTAVDFSQVWGIEPFYFGESLAQLFTQPFKIKVAAVIVDHEDYTRFAETVAQNRGATFEMFHDREKALHWLLSPRDSTP